MHALSQDNKNFNIKEPFQGLFTQGMVCHETYKDQNNNWVSPDEITTINGKKFLAVIILKKLILDLLSQCLNQKKYYRSRGNNSKLWSRLSKIIYIIR